MILITHALGVVASVCDRVLVMYAGKIVEEAAVDALFAQPQHPYTLGLMQSIPRWDADTQRAAAGDRRPAAEHAASAQRLRVSSALPVCA